MRSQPMQTEAHVGTGVAWKWLWAPLTAVWVKLPIALLILAGMISLNLTVAAAIALLSGTACSGKGQRVIGAKVLTLLLTGLVYIVYEFAGRTFGFNLGFHLGTLVAAFYISNEFKAFIEICKGQGVEIPPILPDSVMRLLQREKMTSLNLTQGKPDSLDDRSEAAPKR